VIAKDDSGDSTDKNKELDALLSAADRDLLGAIRDSVDLDTGFAQVLNDLAGPTPSGQPTGSEEADAGGRVPGYSRTLDPVPAGEVSSAARMIQAGAGPKGREPLHYPRALITLAVAVVAALQVAVLFSLSQNHWFASAHSGATVTSPPSEPIAGGPARGSYFFRPPRMQRVVILADKVGAFASLRFAADSAGIGGNPLISYLKDSGNGPVLLLSGLPTGTATRFLSSDAGQSCGNCSEVSYWNYPFPSGGELIPLGTTVYIAGPNGRVILRTIQNQPSGQVVLFINWFPDLA
jgi:hypothetical protein